MKTDYSQIWPHLRQLTAFILLIIAGLGLIPGSLLRGVDVGLDSSWMISINLARLDGRIFGTDYIFTYGPLGYLWTRVGVGIPIVIFVIYDVWIWTQLMGLTLYTVRRLSLLAAALFVLTLIVAPSDFFLVAAFCGMLFLGLAERITIPIFLSGLSALLCLYIKVNYGIILCIVWIWTVLLAASCKFISWRRTVTMIIIWFSLLLLSSYLLKVALFDYFIGSLYLVTGYNEAMNVPISILATNVVPALGLLAVFCLLTLCQVKSLWHDPLRMMRYAITALCAFLLFKNAFVRAHPGHISQFYNGLPLTIGFLSIFERKWTRRACIGLMTICLVFAVTGPHLKVRLHYKDLQSRLWPKPYFSEVLNTQLADTMRNYPTEMKSVRYIPDHILDKINEGSVDIVPVEITYASINNLHYNPRPVPQSYSAYNSYLDGMNAKKYHSSNAPDTIIYQYGAIDKRHPFWDESITKRVMLTNYQFPGTADVDEDFYLKRYPDVGAAVAAGRLPNARYHYDNAGRFEGRTPALLYLVRRKQPLKTSFTRQNETVLTLGKPFPIAINESPLYLYARIQYTLLGWLRNLFFQLPPLYVELNYVNGDRAVYRAVKPILETGVLVNKKVSNAYEAIQFFQTFGRDNIDVESIQFTTPSPKYYRTTIPAEIWQLQAEKPKCGN